MNNCKACNKPIEEDSIAKFCSDECASNFNRVMNKISNQNAKLKKEKEEAIMFSWQTILKRKGKYTISNTQLEEIYDSNRQRSNFEMLMASQNLKLVKGDGFSVIKKVG